MKSEIRVHAVDGILKGERLELMALNANEFILTVAETEAYGDERQAASMALTREQLSDLVSLAVDVLIDTIGGHNAG